MINHEDQQKELQMRLRSVRKNDYGEKTEDTTNIDENENNLSDDNKEVSN